MRDIKAGVLIDVVAQYGTSVPKICLIEIALYREMGVSSPSLEAVMIDTHKDRQEIAQVITEADKVVADKSDDVGVTKLIGIDSNQWPNDPKLLRRYKDLRETFKEITKLPEGSYERNEKLHFNNRFVMALWKMFKAGYCEGFTHLRIMGQANMHYHVVGKLTNDGYSFADKPHRHTSVATALREQDRLAAKHEGTKFGIFSLVSSDRKMKTADREYGTFVPAPINAQFLNTNKGEPNG